MMRSGPGWVPLLGLLVFCVCEVVGFRRRPLGNHAYGFRLAMRLKSQDRNLRPLLILEILGLGCLSSMYSREMERLVPS